MEYCKGLELKIEFLRCNNAGEHQAQLIAACNRHGIAMEYTAPGTPQQNEIVEQRFATNWDKALVMMLAGQLKPEIQKLLWAEATKLASLWTNLTINMATNEPPDKMWYGVAHWENRIKKIVSKMNPFGRIGYVKTKKKIAGKFVEKTTKCVHMSHAEDHLHHTYRMYNPMTRAVILMRNVTWAAWAPSDSQDTLSTFLNKIQMVSLVKKTVSRTLHGPTEDPSPMSFLTMKPKMISQLGGSKTLTLRWFQRILQGGEMVMEMVIGPLMIVTVRMMKQGGFKLKKTTSLKKAMLTKQGQKKIKILGWHHLHHQCDKR
jgi:hypothetical protein